MTHAAMTEEAQREAGIETTLLRLSVGIEHMPDLVSDISAALDRIQKSTSVPFKMAHYA
jgi:cystathionine gamma-synthase